MCWYNFPLFFYCFEILFYFSRKSLKKNSNNVSNVILYYVLKEMETTRPTIQTGE